MFVLLMPLAFAGPAVLPSAYWANAQTATTDCSSIMLSAERLDCYDASHASVRVTFQSPTRIGRWNIETVHDPFNTRDSVSMTLNSSAVRSRWNQHMQMSVNCSAGRATISLHWNMFLGSGRPLPDAPLQDVLIRLGDDEAEQTVWMLSRDGKSTNFGDQSAILLTDLFFVDQLAVQTDDVMNDTVTAVFAVTGLADLPEATRDNCGISPS